MMKIGDVAWADGRAWQYVNSRDKAAWWSWNAPLGEPSWASVTELYSFGDVKWLVSEGKITLSSFKEDPELLERVP